MHVTTMPADAFTVLREEKPNIIHHAHLRDGRVQVTQGFTGRSAREVHDAMDANRQRVEALGGQEVTRYRIGRNAPCPCGSGRKFKKCCIPRAALVGLTASR